MVVFRDPPDADGLARERRLGIARALVGAPRLPIELPRFGLTLVDVEPAGRGVDLVLGAPAPLARARLEPARAADPFAIEVGIRETQPTAARFRKQTSVIRERLARAITREKWQAARAELDALKKLPVGVSLSFFRQLIEGISPLTGLVRTGFLCNQDCGFCWQSREWPGYDAAQVRTWIEDLRAMGAESLSISGGEPTLDRNLVEHVRYARSLGMSTVVLETNAIQMGKRPALAAELREAGLTRAFVSLHSADAETSDLATRAPGTHVRTVAGVEALLEAGVPVILNAVITAETVSRLHELPELAARFAEQGELGGLMISTPVPPFEDALARAIIAAPEDVRAALARTIDLAERHSIRLLGLDGPCGPPLCAFGADRRATTLEPRAPLSFRAHVAECEGCAVKGSCHGVQPEAYAMFGPRAVLPVR